ncbi:MAG: hypothetical protein ACYC9I_06385 [Desulfuromonadales bacterium]
MLLSACLECPHGGIREGKSHCRRETVYSYLTRCIQQKALADYLERTTVQAAESRG